MNIVAPRPLFSGEASTVIDNLSVDEGKVKHLGSFKTSLAPENACEREGVHLILSPPFNPFIQSSSGLKKEAQRGMHRAIALYAPRKERIAVHVGGSGVAARGDNL